MIAPMRIGVPTEIKTDEYRVAITPAGVRELVDRGHEVLIQAGAGVGSAIPDAEYAEQGAQIVPDAAAVFAGSDMIVKVKEPQPVEVAMLEPRHTLFTTCTSRRTRSSRRGWSTRAPPAWRTRRSRTPAAGSRCSPR